MGLDLPLDHFRLLGVSPATDVQTVLRTLQLRLDRTPEQGYTEELLQGRAALLRASAELLSNDERRAAYESDLTALADLAVPMLPALDVPSSQEGAGLLLLLEAGQPLETFLLASRCLQPPQAPALGSGREADLTLLAGEAALAAAEEYRRERHFEVAARTLHQGLQLLQRMGQLPQLRQRIQAELDALTPFRVLDLLSRDPTAIHEREEGLTLLEQLVQRRGGLEGTADQGFAPEDFQPFFKQIRSYLTVQEQLDLFERWSKQGSGAANFLGSIALTASGFAQRKPERIAVARDRLEASARAGIDPLLANLDLLLGDVDGAIQRFEAGADPELKLWASHQSEEPLGRLCAWCRDWLSRDVLPGYRDLEADADLEAYFSDRDVVAWVEREDRRRGRSFSDAPAGRSDQGFRADPNAASAGLEFGAGISSGFGSGFAAGLGSGFGSGFHEFQPPDLDPGAAGADAGLAFPDGPLESAGWGNRDADANHDPAANGAEDGESVPLGWGIGTLRQFANRCSWRAAGTLIPSLAILGVLLILGSWLLRGRGPQPAPPPATSPRAGSEGISGTARPQATLPTAQPAAAPASPSPPPRAAAQQRSVRSLSVAEPNETEIKALLEAWLGAKATVLAGANQPAGLDRIVREGPLRRLASDRQRDQGLGQIQTIDAEVDKLTIQERSPNRIAVVANLRYSDKTIRAGKEVNQTKPTSLRNVYVFGRDGDRWRLASFGPAR
jgi:hypothetical protein